MRRGRWRGRARGRSYPGHVHAETAMGDGGERSARLCRIARPLGRRHAQEALDHLRRYGSDDDEAAGAGVLLGFHARLHKSRVGLPDETAGPVAQQHMPHPIFVRRRREKDQLVEPGPSPEKRPGKTMVGGALDTQSQQASRGLGSKIARKHPLPNKLLRLWAPFEPCLLGAR
ncbi:MAG: hypothetical protein AB7T14_04310 [Candidatus Methylacidiphilaceae bacterium]